MNAQSRNLFYFVAIFTAISQAVAPHAGYSQSDKQVTPKIVWEAETTSAGNGFGAILLDGDLVFAGDDHGDLHAFDRKSGEIRWTSEHGSRIHGAPVADGGNVYFASSKGLTAVERNDGDFRWTYGIQNGADYCALAPKQKYVIVGGYDGKLHAISTETGFDVWKINIVDDAPVDPPEFDGARARLNNLPARPSGITCDDECAYACIFDQCRVVAIDLNSGKKKWSTQTEGWMLAAPTVSSDSVYVVSQDKHLWRLDKATGEMKWKFKTGSRVEGGCALDKDFAYFASCDGRFYCVDIKDGKEKWRFETDKDAGRRRAIYSRPYLSKSSVLFAAGAGKLYSLAKLDGAPNWKFELFERTETYCDTISDGERIYLVTRKPLDKSGKNAIVAVTPAE